MKKELIVAVIILSLIFGCISPEPIKKEVAKKTTTEIEKAEEVSSLNELEPLDELPPIDEMQNSIEGTDMMTAPNKIPKK